MRTPRAQHAIDMLGPDETQAEKTKRPEGPQEVSTMRFKGQIIIALAGSFEAKAVPVEIEAKDGADARTQLERRARVEQGVARDCGEKGARAVYANVEAAGEGAQQA